MDTHITDAGLDHAGAGLASPVGLPGEGSPSQGAFSARDRLGVSSSNGAADLDKPSILERAPRVRRARRNALLAGVAAVVLIGVGGAGLYVFRDNVRVNNLTHGLYAKASGLISRARPAPTEVGVTAHATAAAAHKPAHANDAAPATPPLSLDSTAALAREFDAFQSFKKPADTRPGPRADAVALVPVTAPRVSSAKPAHPLTPPLPTATVGHPPEAVPQEAGVAQSAVPAPSSKAAQAFLSRISSALPASPVAPVVRAAPSTAVATAAPSTTAATAVPAPTVPTAPPPPAAVDVARDPSVVAAVLKAAPMTSTQQIKVIGLIENLGAQLRDTRREVVQLNQVVAQLSKKVETRTTDFESRLGLIEAAAIVQSSARAGLASGSSEDTSATPPASSATHAVRPASARSTTSLPAAAAPVPERRTVKDYVVKGASPGLAVLAALNPAPGSGGVIEVGVGDLVPGVGRIKRVYQHGTTWIVETDHGSIQQ